MSLIDDVRPYNGREPENPMDVVAAIMREKAYLNLCIGIEAPQYYLTPYEYHQLNALLGDARVCEPNTLIQDIKLIRSPAELAFIKKAVEMTDAGMDVRLKPCTRAARNMTSQVLPITALSVWAATHRPAPQTSVWGNAVIAPTGSPMAKC